MQAERLPLLLAEARCPRLVHRVYTRGGVSDERFMSICDGHRLLLGVRGARHCSVREGTQLRRVVLVPGTVLVVPPGCAVGTTPQAAFLTVGFNSDGVVARCTAGRAPIHRNRKAHGQPTLSACSQALDASTAADLADLMRVILRRPPDTPDDDEQLCRLSGLAIDAAISGLTRGHAAEDPSGELRFRHAAEYVRGHCDEDLDRPAVAAYLGCHPNHLPRLFARHAGCSFQAFLTRARMERAAELLADPGLGLDRVAGLCGYATTSGLIARFKAHHGLTPARWRSRQRSRGATAD
ncbi:MAG: AraC family transcriptional regulator [Planctomycetota bacterium]|jgi:AraC-like DNA-binding protein|nr:AraC family transcriptional regulator [Planctomycetota bacterium]